jgi:hypothetical protein
MAKKKAVLSIIIINLNDFLSGTLKTFSLKSYSFK